MVKRPLKVGLNNYGYCHNHDAAYRAAMIYSFIATCNKADVNPREWMEDVMPLLKGIASDDFASMEDLFPGEWKKAHPEYHSMVHHTTEAEHVAAILKSRAKRKESASNFAELHKTWQTLPNCAKLRRNPIETYMCLAGRFHYT